MESPLAVEGENAKLSFPPGPFTRRWLRRTRLATPPPPAEHEMKHHTKAEDPGLMELNKEVQNR